MTVSPVPLTWFSAKNSGLERVDAAAHSVATNEACAPTEDTHSDD